MSAGVSSQNHSNGLGPLWITIGLAIMVVGAFYPNAPVVTALSLIALGATEVAVSRRHESPSPVPIVLIQGTTYALLYALFIGARLHTHGEALAGPLTMLDLAASMFPIAIVLRRILACLRSGSLSRP